MTTESSSANSPSEVKLYETIENYDWGSDPEFSGGLQSILQSAQSPDHATDLESRAKCFYLSRKHGVRIDVNGYKAWKKQQKGTTAQENGIELGNGTESAKESSAPPAETQNNDSGAQDDSTPAGDAPYPTSFSDIVELITSGKPIPGIKDIPDTILEGQGTQPSANRRKKPWEKDVS
ncbi:hypothetical protein P152DRAFT_508324 [Eremomyces bilateralis CBS 781.70]|uniref:Uncharacterized protein n=1 Tax=Eremomyces bilateralis CBS 781.70 TaxID=1392243 RepID=A0A6G1FZC0_9PEZI|nr:uncharacterized protein P152DRAFT_508324 [Eremomyces bilateralis CBS 781.70]KAF1811020.1 hypothetical protein P152DRAFT_508324 [Eremomyces bilateralis CBS 781.70]